MIPEPKQVTARIAEKLTAALDDAPAVAAARDEYDAAFSALHDAQQRANKAEEPLIDMMTRVPVTPAQLDTYAAAAQHVADTTSALAAALRKVQAAADATASNILGGSR